MAATSWAIAYDLDVKGMKDEGYTKSNVTTFYNKIRKCLKDNNFEKMKQLSIYTCSKENSIADAFKVITALKGVSDADRFIKRLNMFRVEDFNDLLPLISFEKKSSEDDEIEARIEEVFQEDEQNEAIA